MEAQDYGIAVLVSALCGFLVWAILVSIEFAFHFLGYLPIVRFWGWPALIAVGMGVFFFACILSAIQEFAGNL